VQIYIICNIKSKLINIFEWGMIMTKSYNSYNFSIFLAIAATFILPISTDLFSQDNSLEVLEEVVVTARKREEGLQDTPVAITAFTGNDLSAKGINNLTDIGAFAPNVTMGSNGFAGAGSYSGQFFIRGIGQTEFLPMLEPGVGLYIDGIYFGRAVGSAMELVDIDRVEVLRGPQGTLYGKNTVGGAINIISKRPQGEGAGYLDVILGSYGRNDYRGSYDFSLSDSTSAKITFSSQNDGAYGEALDFATNKKVADLAGRDSMSFRANLSTQLSDNTTVDFSVDHTDRSDDMSVNQMIFWDPMSGPGLGGLWLGLVGVPTGQILSSDIITGDPDKTYGSIFPNDLEVTGYNLTFESDLGWSTLTSITSHRTMEAAFGRDGDANTINFSSTFNQQDQDQTSQEFRLSGQTGDLSWVAGYFFFEESYFDHNDVFQGPGMYSVLEVIPNLAGLPCAPPWLAPGCPGNPINVALDIQIDVSNWVDTESSALFTQMSYDLSDRLTLTGGTRISDEEKSVKMRHFKPTSQTFAVPLTNASKDWQETTSMVSLDYAFEDDILIYISLSEGFKMGGFNPRPTNGLEITSFDPETVETTEIGFKSTWGGRVRLNAAFFSSDYNDLQFSVNKVDPATGSVLLLVGNAAESNLDGFEVELEALLSDNLSLRASYGVLDFEISSLAANTTPEVTLATQNPKTPDNNYSISLVHSNGPSSFRIDWSHEAGSFNDIQNTPILRRLGNDMVNARWSFKGNNGWEWAVFGTNLRDERVVDGGTSNISSFGHAEAVYSRPREYGVSLRINF